MGPEAGVSEMLAGCLEGRKECWDAFVRRFSKLVYWCIWRVLEKRGIAAAKEEWCEEIYQDFFLKISEPSELKRLSEVTHLESYLRVLVTHMVWDRMRAQSRQERLTAGYEQQASIQKGDEATDIIGAVLDEEVSSLLTQAVASLPDAERRCVELCFRQNRTHREIGLLMNLPQDTVSSMIYRARKKIGLYLQSKGYEFNE